MNHTGPHPFQAEWSLTSNGNTLDLDVALTASVDLFVCDRTWVRGPARERSPDPNRVYRFVVDDSLVLLMGPSPRPAVEMIERYTPLSSQVSAGTTHCVHATVEVPVVEYSPFGRNPESPSEVVTLRRAVLIVHYAVASELVEPAFAPLGEPDAGYVVYGGKRAMFARVIPEVVARRRTGAFPRPTIDR